MSDDLRLHAGSTGEEDAMLRDTLVMVKKSGQQSMRLYIKISSYQYRNSYHKVVVVVNFISNSQYKDTKILNYSIHNFIYWCSRPPEKPMGSSSWWPEK